MSEFVVTSKRPLILLRLIGILAERVDITFLKKINDVVWLHSPNPLFDAQRLFDAMAEPCWLSHDHPPDLTRAVA